jgi:glycosyltransferase involved in cell wall biosynthesis
MAVIISGVGRSGTTTIYQILGKGFINKYRHARCVYEPYLWDIPEVQNTAEVKGQPFSVEQVGLYNMNVHCNTPLFLSGTHRLHDHWLRKVFCPIPFSSDTAQENVMAKVIRGAGRLEAALTRYKNLKIIIITRNIIDTANSGLGLFSFFGDEFHPSDKMRFIDEINEKFFADIDIQTVKNELQWSVLWWHYMTEASFRTLEKYPGRVKLVPYEHYVKNKKKLMGEIFDFAGIDRAFIDQSLFNKGAGPTTSVSYLSRENIGILKDEMSWYFERLKTTVGLKFNPNRFYENLLKKYSERQFVESLLLSIPTNITAVQWRNRIRNDLINKEIKSQSASVSQPFCVTSAIAEFGSNDKSLRISRKKNVNNSKKEKIGVLVTCYNNADSIANTIYSILAQTRKVDLIYVADDCSTDNSFNIIKSIAKKYSNIQIIKREGNVGVSANRDLAIRSMDVDYMTTIDGDDLFYPDKIELELNALEGSKNKISFSDIVVISKNQSFLQNTAPYSGKNKKEILTMITSRTVPVPRDIMFPKSLFLRADGFDVGMSIYEDWAFKMRMVAVAAEGGFVHSGGKGTIYDRRKPGLSGRKPIEHAYGQLLALARNVDVLQNNHIPIEGGLLTVGKQLEGNMFKRMKTYIESMRKNNNYDSVYAALAKFWNEGIFKCDIQTQYEKIWQFTSI